MNFLFFTSGKGPMSRVILPGHFWTILSGLKGTLKDLVYIMWILKILKGQDTPKPPQYGGQNFWEVHSDRSKLMEKKFKSSLRCRNLGQNF